MAELVRREMPVEVVAALQRRRKIQAIKLLRQAWGLELKEAKQYIDNYMDENGELSPVRSSASETGVVRFFLVIVTLIMLAIAYKYL